MFRILVGAGHFKNCLNDMYLIGFFNFCERKNNLKKLILIWWTWLNVIQKITILLTSFLWGGCAKVWCVVIFSSNFHWKYWANSRKKVYVHNFEVYLWNKIFIRVYNKHLFLWLMFTGSNFENYQCTRWS